MDQLQHANVVILGVTRQSGPPRGTNRNFVLAEICRSNQERQQILLYETFQFIYLKY